jgi:hypothetical protein
MAICSYRCNFCHKEVLRNDDQVYGNVYCDSQCFIDFKKSTASNIIRHCSLCGVPVKRMPSGALVKNTFCSKDCYHKFYRRRRGDPPDNSIDVLTDQYSC